MSFKPDGYPSLSPYMIVENAEASLRFAEQVFGGVRLRTFPDEQGNYMHAEIRIGEQVIMLADGGNGWEPHPAYVHLYVEDVDDAYSKGLAHGALEIRPPVKGSDADKRGGFTDPGGITWWIATQIDQA